MSVSLIKSAERVGSNPLDYRPAPRAGSHSTVVEPHWDRKRDEAPGRRPGRDLRPPVRGHGRRAREARLTRLELGAFASRADIDRTRVLPLVEKDSPTRPKGPLLVRARRPAPRWPVGPTSPNDQDEAAPRGKCSEPPSPGTERARRTRTRRASRNREVCTQPRPGSSLSSRVDSTARSPACGPSSSTEKICRSRIATTHFGRGRANSRSVPPTPHAIRVRLRSLNFSTLT